MTNRTLSIEATTTVEAFMQEVFNIIQAERITKVVVILFKDTPEEIIGHCFQFGAGDEHLTFAATILEDHAAETVTEH